MNAKTIRQLEEQVKTMNTPVFIIRGDPPVITNEMKDFLVEHDYEVLGFRSDAGELHVHCVRRQYQNA